MSNVDIWIDGAKHVIPWVQFWPTLEQHEPQAMTDSDACDAMRDISRSGGLVKVSVCGDDPNWCVEILTGPGWWSWRRIGVGYGIRLGQAFEQALSDYRSTASDRRGNKA